MPRIRILSDTLVSQIAAGEVVERPASVVKELVENALDAAATSLEIELEGGGARRIRVADDGSGMDRDDALLAFDRHATSKISTFGDLERVGTLGFRGEALASIAAVAKVELTTALSPGDGTRVRIEGGRVLTAEPAARARGTTIEIASLFWNVPARRKFLKSRETELRRCVEVVEGYALARPDVAFRVRHEGRLMVEAPALGAGEAGLRARIAQVFGPRLERDLEPIGGAASPGIGGLIGSPRTSRGRRSFVFVNRRLVRDRAILAAFYRAVREEWRSEEFPSLFLFLDLPAERIDVNVHPQKAEVRFREPGFPELVGRALRSALARARGEEAAPLRAVSGPLSARPAWEGLGGRGPGDLGAEIREAPAGARDQDLSVQDQDRSKDLHLRGGGAGAAPGAHGGGAAQAGARDQDTSVQDQDRSKDFHLRGGGAGAAPGAYGGGAAQAEGAFPLDESFSGLRSGKAIEEGRAPAAGAVPLEESFSDVQPGRAVEEGGAPAARAFPIDDDVSFSRPGPGEAPARAHGFEENGFSSSVGRGREVGRIAVPVWAPLERGLVPLSGRSGEARPFRLLGQYKGSLVLLEGPDGLYLLDQHVAHERILYERLRRDLASERPASQRMVEPLLLELSRAEAMKLAALAPALDSLGFEIEELSGGSLGVAAAPASLGAEAARGLLLTLATDEEATPANLRRRLLDDFAASMACKAAVKMHHPLSAEKLEALVSELFRADNPYACPHGRPVVLVLADADLERRFGRR